MNQQVLPCLPNFNLRVIKSNNYKLVDFLDSVDFKHKLSGLELDVMLILLHFRLNGSNVIYFNTDDILEFRNKKKKIYANFLRAGYPVVMRENIFWTLWNLKEKEYINFYTYNKYNFEASVNEKNLRGERFKINSKLLALNPYKKEWQKAFGCFLEKNKARKQIQVKKFLETVTPAVLAPYQIRERFENALDELSDLGIISNWRYKRIDECQFRTKGWLNDWKSLSVYICWSLNSII